MRWLPPAKLNGKIGYYLFYRKSSAGSSTAERFVISGSVHYQLVSGLKPFTNYTFSVVPYNLRKNLSGPPFGREGQTSAAGMHFTAFTYSCFEKGYPTKPYATMPQGIMGNGGLWYLIKALGILAT